jgi:exonuclease SbcD
MSTRLLHLADLHLDRAFAGMGCQGDLAIRRRLGLREALRRAGEYAVGADCAAVTIGGDLYEHDRAGSDTAAFLAQTFRSWQPMRVFLAPGNHDPLVPGSIYSRTEWPDNVHLFTSTALEPVAIDDGLTLWGLAHREPAWQGDPLAGISAGSDGGVHLALFHGAEVGSRPDGKSIHGPFHAARIRDCGLDAVLCGHYHRRRVDPAAGLLYPGSPEPLTFDETEPRGSVLVTVAGDGSVDYQPLADNRWHATQATCDLTDVTAFAAALEAAGSTAIAACSGTDPDRTMLRLDLRGEVADTVAVDTFTAETFIRERTGIAAVRVRDLTIPNPTTDVGGPGTVRAAFAASVTDALGAVADDDERSVLADALSYGLQALSGAEVGLR